MTGTTRTCFLLLALAATPAAGQEPDPGEIEFASEAHRRRHGALRAWIAARAGGEGWTHREPRVLGNFVSERWCRGHDAAGCGGAAHDGPGEATWELSVLHHPREWPRVFGLVVAGEIAPEAGQRGVRLYWAEEGRSVVGSTFAASFYETGDARRIDLGSAYVHEVAGFAVEDPGRGWTSVIARVPAPDGMAAERRRLAASAESFRDTALARFAALETEVARAVAAHLVRKAVYPPEPWGGIPPEPSYEALSQAEEEAFLARARREIGERRAALEGFESLHARLAEVLPPESVWE